MDGQIRCSSYEVGNLHDQGHCYTPMETVVPLLSNTGNRGHCEHCCETVTSGHSSATIPKCIVVQQWERMSLLEHCVNMCNSDLRLHSCNNDLSELLEHIVAE